VVLACNQTQKCHSSWGDPFWAQPMLTLMSKEKSSST
jgi:hypothetical protein